ncbi:MAG TPA: CehA/McbA family metallohydrolase [Actinomycetes bacterium]|jgi:predicted metal-dependent phosphoesterase TrpH|nr:CehA/McbA family metallohydrolase [Actinomycetes bacterium]
MARRVYRGRWTPEDRRESVYRYLPFEVGPGAPGVSLRLGYDRSAAVLDLGLLDPAGFRGWSGGARERVTVTPDWATPGYLPGGLLAGEWKVMLGLYRVPEDGVDFSLEVRLEAAAAPPRPRPAPLPERPPPRRLPATPGRRWLAGDLHSHTVHSDGALNVDQLACLARGRGLDFLAVTDHNTVSHHRELGAVAARVGVLLIAGQELTTEEGHANCLGPCGWVDFREPADEWLRAAEAGGGLLSINHPLLGPLAWRRPLRRRPPLAEVWHWTWDGWDTAPLEWWRANGGVPVGGSDFHRPKDGIPLGAPTTWVEAEGGAEAGAAGVLDELRAGRVALSAGPGGPLLLRVGDEVLVLGGEGTLLHAPDAAPRPVRADAVTLAAGEGPYRLASPSGRTLALTP